MKPLQLKFVKLVVITGLYLIVINRFEFPTFGGHTTRSGIRLKPSDDSNFVMTVERQYPFKFGWSFDDYKRNTHATANNTINITKLSGPQLLIENFKFIDDKNQTLLLPFFNPSLIRIDSIPNYRTFMQSLLVNSSQNMHILNRTIYIAIGRFIRHQCEYSYSNAHLFSEPTVESGANGILLLDQKFNILQYVSLKIIIDYSAVKLRRKFKRQRRRRKARKYLGQIFNELVDCRLFSYLSHVFIICGSYAGEHNIHHVYIAGLQWKESLRNDKMEIVAYVSTNSEEFLQFKRLYHTPNNSAVFGPNPKNLIALEYDNELYFEWELKHSYFIKVISYEYDTFDYSKYENYDIFGGMTAVPAYHHKYPLINKWNNSVAKHSHSYHQSTGFIHLNDSKEYLAVGHVHYDLYRPIPNPFNIAYGHHYTHFFYTIEDSPPFKMKRISAEFCFNSPYIRWNSTLDCDVIQFVTGLVQNTINSRQYLFVSYGINDCAASIVRIPTQFVTDMLVGVLL